MPMIDLHVHEVHWCVAHGHPVLALRVRDSDRFFAVALAVEDATALAAAPTPGSGNRTRLYSLLEATVAALGGDISEVQLFVGAETILQAAIRFTGPQGDFTLPTHFADGIALAHRRHVPLRMADEDVARVPMSHRADRPTPSIGPGPQAPTSSATPSALRPYRDFIDSLNLDSLGAPESE